MFTIMSMQSKIGQHCHQMKWNIKSFLKNCTSKHSIRYWAQNSQKETVQLGLGFRWKFATKETKTNEFLD